MPDSIEMGRMGERIRLLNHSPAPKQFNKKACFWLVLTLGFAATSIAALYFFIDSVVKSDQNYDHPFEYSDLCRANTVNHANRTLDPDTLCNDLTKLHFTSQNSSLITAHACKEGLEQVCALYQYYLNVGFSSVAITISAGCFTGCFLGLFLKSCQTKPETLRSAPSN